MKLEDISQMDMVDYFFFSMTFENNQRKGLEKQFNKSRA